MTTLRIFFLFLHPPLLAAARGLATLAATSFALAESAHCECSRETQMQMLPNAAEKRKTSAENSYVVHTGTVLFHSHAARKFRWAAVLLVRGSPHTRNVAVFFFDGAAVGTKSPSSRPSFGTTD